MDWNYISQFNLPKWKHLLPNHIKIVSINLTIEDLHSFQTNNISKTLHKKFFDACGEMQDGWFIRPCTRSIKDAWYQCNVCPVDTYSETINRLLLSNRFKDDLKDHINFLENTQQNIENYPLMVHLISWRNIFKNGTEFRCFVNNSKLFAVSQYDIYSDLFISDLDFDQLLIKCKEFIEKCSDLPQKCVVDIVVPHQGDIELIELNPYGKKSTTSAIFFDWNEIEENEYANNIYFKYKRFGKIRKYIF